MFALQDPIVVDADAGNSSAKPAVFQVQAPSNAFDEPKKQTGAVAPTPWYTVRRDLFPLECPGLECASLGVSFALSAAKLAQYVRIL